MPRPRPSPDSGQIYWRHDNRPRCGFYAKCLEIDGSFPFPRRSSPKSPQIRATAPFETRLGRSVPADVGRVRATQPTSSLASGRCKSAGKSADDSVLDNILPCRMSSDESFSVTAVRCSDATSSPPRTSSVLPLRRRDRIDADVPSERRLRGTTECQGTHRRSPCRPA